MRMPAKQLGLALYASFADSTRALLYVLHSPFPSPPFIPVLVSGRPTDLLTALAFLLILPIITL